MKWNKKRPAAEPLWTPIEEGGPAPAPEADAVEAMRAWTDSGRELAEIVAEVPTYDANPDTAHYLRERSREASVAEIDAEYARRRAAIDTEDRHRRAGAAREIRAVSEAETDADEATADLAMIRDYERESSPITAARSLAASARRWRGYDLGYSLVGSALSAVGITATLHVADLGLPVWGCAGLAVAAETVLTVRVVDLIGRLARMEEQDRSEPPAPPEATKATESGKDADAEESSAAAPRRESTRTHLMVQAGVLLGLSVAVNAAGAILFGAGLLGVLGMCGAVLAALAGLGSHASSRAAARVVTANLATWRGPNWHARRGELRTRASGAYIPALGQAAPEVQEHGAAPAAEEPTEEEQHPVVPDEPDRRDRAARAARVDWALADQDVADTLFADLVRRLDDGEDGDDNGGGGGLGAPEPTGPAAGPAAAQEAGGGTPPGTPGSTPGEQAEGAPAGTAGAPAPGTPLETGADQDGSATGASNRARVLEAIRHRGTAVSNRELERLLGISRTTVRTHRTALAKDGHPVYEQPAQTA